MRNKGKLGVAAFLLCLSVLGSGCGEEVPEVPPQDDYADVPVITQKHNYTETPYVDYTLADLPEFVDDLSQCTDPDKLYVLPDGYVYRNEKHFVRTAVNQLQLATDEGGAVYNDCGYRDNARIRGILEITECDYSFVTGFIPVKAGDTIYFSGNVFDPAYIKAASMTIVFYHENKNVLSSVSLSAAEQHFEILATNAEGYASAVKVKEDSFSEAPAYVRFTLVGSGADQFISVNEPLDQGYEEISWVWAEQYVPADWHQEIKTSVDAVNSISLEDESNVIKFMFAADIHLDPYSGTSYTESLGKVCAEVMRACEIPFFVTGGDNCTQSSGFMPSDFEPNMEELLEQLSPIPQRNILLAVGNHDGATGMNYDNYGEKAYYRFQLNNEERSAVFFDWQRETNENKKFDADGTYYYLDDSATKTRYIVLNSMWSQWEGNAEGYVWDLEHSFFKTPLFGSQQLNWFAETALDMPPDYAAVIITHFAPDAKDFEVFKGIVDAFSGKTAYKGTYVGTEEWQSTKIAVNYEHAAGEIIAVFQGHRHIDAEFDCFANVPCINITTTGAYWAVNDENPVQRVKGTSTEFAVDAVTIDRAARTIYITRVGAGEDRVIKY